jgi:glycerol uptake facilitator-like aquaporin
MTPMMKIHKNRRQTLAVKLYAEWLGSMACHFLGSACGTVEGNAAANTVMVYWAAKMSGGHLNPAVTVAFTVLGYTPPVDMVCYMIAQMCGCVMGSMLQGMLTPGLKVRWSRFPIELPSQFPSRRRVWDGCVLPHHSLSAVRILLLEMMCTSVVVLATFCVVWYSQHKSGYGTIGPIIGGIAGYAATLATSPWTGGALDPARTLAPLAVIRCTRGRVMILCVVGQFMAGILAPLLIVPWYGLSTHPWYSRWLSQVMKDVSGGAAHRTVPSAPRNSMDDMCDIFSDSSFSYDDDEEKYKCGTLVMRHRSVL